MPGFDDLLTHVRGMLRRAILLRAPWLSGVRDGPGGEALVAFLMDDPDPGAAHLAEAGAVYAAPVGGRTLDAARFGERLGMVARHFALDALDLDALAVVLAPEFDARYLAAYRVLWSDPERRYVDEDFLSLLLQPAGERPVGVLAATSPLVTLGFVGRVETSRARAPLLRPSERLLRFLAGADGDGQGPWTLHPAAAPERWGRFAVLGDRAEPLEESLDGRRVVFVQAGARVGLALGIRQLAAEYGRPLLVLDVAEVADASAAERESGRASPLLDDDGALARALVGEARLTGAWLLLSGAETLDVEPPGRCRLLAELLASAPDPVFVACEGPVPANLLRRVALPLGAGLVELPSPAAAARRAMWEHLLSGLANAAPAVAQLTPIPLGPEQMEVAVALSAHTGRRLLEVARQIATEALPRLATRVESSLGWGDVVLRAEELEEIESIRTFGAHYERIMTGWGLGRKAAGRGIKVLFSGPSGTGKTLTSSLLAKDLGRDLYRVDLSMVMSKWVGETEKHFTSLFRQARDAGAALLFDEAEALFGQRSGSVASAGERFATNVVNLLLQEIELFDGMLILTTNLESAIDSAFARRLHYRVAFRAPDAAARARIWEIHLPADLPLADEVDLDWLGERYELTGGEIHKAAIRAAVNAIRSGAGAVGLQELHGACAAQYVEKGRLPPSPPASR